MRTDEFSFHLPPELIAQQPAPERDQSRLFVLQRRSGVIEHRRFLDLAEYLQAEDLLVLNNAKVIPARLLGEKKGTGGEVELLLTEEARPNAWWAMARPGKRLRNGTQVRIRDKTGLQTTILATVRDKNSQGHCLFEFSGAPDIRDELGRLGQMPLPPYIVRPHGSEPADEERYQTVFAKASGSVAAPTAGLHFSPRALDDLRRRNIQMAEVTLHVGLGTFAPVKAERVEEHVMHEERYEITPGAAEAVARAKSLGKRVIAVGTTSLRVLETVAARHEGSVVAEQGRTRLFVYPPYEFRVVDALLTNFHLPQSTLLMLVSAFASPGEVKGRELVLRAYEEAVRQRYRFFSYGDAMLLI